MSPTAAVALTTSQSPVSDIVYDNVQRFSGRGAQTGSVRIPLLESAPVSEKRVALKRSPRHEGYGH
jgi:hypothetical protein